VLEKVYIYREEVYLGDFGYDRANGPDIKWDLSKEFEIKEQRNESEYHF
jgi:hypothetical protein